MSAENKRGRGRPRGSSTAGRRIFTAALQVFAERGLHGSTVEEIIAVAGVSRPTFYRTFTSKEAVYDAIVERGLREVDLILASAITEADALATEDEKMDFVLRNYLQACLATGPLVEIMNQVEYERPELKATRDASRQRVGALLSDAIGTAGYAEPDPLLLEGLMAAIDRVVCLCYREHADPAERLKRAWGILEPLSASFATIVR